MAEAKKKRIKSAGEKTAIKQPARAAGSSKGSFLADNFLGVSILGSAVIVAVTLLIVFGPGGGGNGRTAATAPSAGGQTAGDPISTENLRALAESVGADGEEFATCLSSDRYTEAVQADFDQGVALGVNGTPSFLINGELVVGAIPLSQISAVIDDALATGGDGPNAVTIGDAPTLGSANAPVTMVEFSDYECPFCRQFYLESLSGVKSQYVDTGRVRFVYKDFPLTNIHPSAVNAAKAARCVREELGDDAYWEMHDAIFEAQA